VERKRSLSANLQTNLIAGVLTLIPVVVVWLALNFVFATLFSFGAPLAFALTNFVTARAPSLEPLLHDEVFLWFVAVVVALLVLYTIGAAASRMVGIKLIALIEGLIARIPLVDMLYSASKQVVGALQQKPGGMQRVVLVEFPRPGMKAIGLVTQTFLDAKTGIEMAAVFVPTSPNPTSGYLVLVPVKDAIPTEMTLDQAMTMIVSGGAIAPATLSMSPLVVPPSAPGSAD
jgi:uncharacterized membrane protein